MTTEAEPATMNGAAVIARTADAVYLRIPANLAQPINGGCACTYCAAHPEHVARWDALCVPVSAPKNANYFAVTVHMPDAASFRQHIAKATAQRRNVA